MQNKTILWLDDMRSPYSKEWAEFIYEHIPLKFIKSINFAWVKTYNKFEEYITNNAMPYKIYFDHDLGIGKSGYDAAKFLVEYCLDRNIGVPAWEIQSSNPPGKQNINGLLSNYHKYYQTL